MRIGTMYFSPITCRNKESSNFWCLLPDQERVLGAYVVAALPAMLLVLGSLGKRTVPGLDAFAFYSHERGTVKN